ncbi:type IV secretion system DNA-binding domain-containing protein [Patescibacteria group bacterium]|nr:type IV secretion system DNA-binding domain-containing protein [Patescibacteria group bacterium]
MAVQYDHEHENEITLFAETNFRNQRRRFGIKTDDRRRHIYVLGKTGMGKTALQQNMVMSDIMAGHGVCYVDPHGDMAEELLDLIPSNRINDIVYFNPADLEYPVGFNILESVNESQKHLVASGLMGVFKKIWPDVWSPRMEYILLNCVLALLDYPGATLLGINRLLVDDEYRKRVIAKIRDPIVKTFWVAEFSSWSEKYQTEAIAPIQNKVGQFLSASVIRNIVSQVRSTIDIRKIMDEGKIFIVNLSKGRIGEENMRLLGGMLISRLQMAAMERVEIPEDDRRDFYLFVDEFQNFANESFASILSEARKYRLSLTVAHQYIEQLTEETRAAVIGNVGTMIVFRVGSTDAEFLEKEFSPTFTVEDLVNLPKFNIYLKLMVDGVASTPFSAATLPPMARHIGSAQKVIDVSRERYAIPRSTIAEKVLRWSGMETSSLRLADESILRPMSDENIKLAKEEDEMEDAEENAGDAEEYLKITPERLKVLQKAPSGGSKKDKPKFSHTCTRCGKVWDMPVQLDPTRPMYCADCMPIVRDERKNKSKISRTNPVEAEFEKSIKKEVEPDQPNRPRIVGEINLPDKPKETVSTDQKTVNPKSLLEELELIKGGAVETKKKKVEAPLNKRQNDKWPNNKPQNQKLATTSYDQADKQDKKAKRRSKDRQKLEDVFSKIEDRVPVKNKEAKEPPETAEPRTLTVFKKTSNNSSNSPTSSYKTLRPGEKASF